MGNPNRGTLSYNSDVSIFVRMHIFPKLDLTVLVEIDCMYCYNSTWDEGTGHYSNAGNICIQKTATHTIATAMTSGVILEGSAE